MIIHNSGNRQPGVELVDSNTFRSQPTSIPIDYDKTYTQFETQPRGEYSSNLDGLKCNTSQTSKVTSYSR